MGKSPSACTKGTFRIGGENAETRFKTHTICGRITQSPNICFNLTPALPVQVKPVIRLIAPVASVGAGLAVLLYGTASDRWPEPNPLAAAIVSATGTPDSAEVDPGTAFSAIVRIFPKPVQAPAQVQAPTATITAPTSIIGKIAPPVLRYIGSVADADGRMVYYIKDESRGRLIRIGKGVNDGDIEFIEATKESVIVSVAGNELSVTR